MNNLTDDKYKKCRAGIHVPVEVDVTYNRTEVYLAAICDVCGANLECDVSPGEWEANYSGDACCVTCEEGTPFCDCEHKNVEEETASHP